METVNNTITDTGFDDVLVGAELFTKLKISSIELNDPQQFAMLRDVSEFLNGHPDPSFVISRVSKNTNPNISNLEFLAGYVGIEKRRQGLMEEVKKLDDELKYYL